MIDFCLLRTLTFVAFCTDLSKVSLVFWAQSNGRQVGVILQSLAQKMMEKVSGLGTGKIAQWTGHFAFHRADPGAISAYQKP